MIKNYAKGYFVTFLLIGGFIICTQINVLGINPQNLTLAMRDSPYLRLIDFLGGGSYSNFSIFAVSVIFIIIARSLMALMTILVPFYHKLLPKIADGETYEKIRLEKHTLILEILVALIYTVIFAVYLIRQNIISTDNLSFITIFGFILFGAFVLMGIIRIIDKSEIMDGLLAIIVAGFITSIVRWFVLVMGEASQTPEPWGRIFIVGIILIAILAAVLMEKYVIKVPISFSNTTRPAKKVYGDQTHIPIKPISPFGKNKCAHTILIFLISYIFDLLRLSSQNYEDSFRQILIGIIFPCVIGILYYLVLKIIRPDYIWDDAAKQLVLRGGFIPGITGTRPIETTANYLREKAKNTFIFESIFQIVALLTVQLANILLLPLNMNMNPLTLVSFWALAEITHDTYAKIKSERTLHGKANYAKLFMKGARKS